MVCPVVGAVLGDFQTGLALGASLELLFMGSVSIGAYVPPDCTSAAVLCTAYVVLLDVDIDVAVGLALPIGTIVLALENLCQPVSNWLLTFIPKFAEKGESKKLLALHWLIGTWAQPLYFVVHFCAIYFGSDAVAWVVGVIPEFVLNGFAAGANILPVMGFAMLGRMIITKKLLPFYFLGFLLTAYIGVPVLGVALLSIVIGIEYTGIMKPNTENLAIEGDDDDFEDNDWQRPLCDHQERPHEDVAECGIARRRVLLDVCRPDGSRVRRHDGQDLEEDLPRRSRGLCPGARAPHVVLQHHGAVRAVCRWHRGIDGGEDREERNPRGVGERRQGSPHRPLSGIGDSIFLTTLRVLAAGIGVSLAQAGNPFAPLIFLLIYNIPAFVLRVWGVQKGYELGVGMLETAQKNGIMDKVMTIAGIVGIMVLGSMTVDMFWAEIAVEFGSGDEVTALQDVLDGILPGMFALICMGLYYWLLGKKVSPTILILGTMLVGVIGVYFGVLA